MTIPLWPHQDRALDMLRTSIRLGKKRPMLQLGTGGGKTRIAGAVVSGARGKGNRALFIVDAISLIDQTVQSFYDLGLHDIGVIQSDHAMTDWSKPIQIASVQTLQRRGLPEADLAFIDEAHVRNQWLEAELQKGSWPTRPVIGLSATPWAKGLGLIYDDLLIPITMRELIDQGRLLDFRVFAPSHPDLKGVQTTGGDFNGAQLGDRMDGLTADIVDTWIKLGEGRPTLCYCVDRAHAKKVQERFLSVGIPAEYIDMNTDGFERAKIQRRLEAGETKVVCNIATLTKGIDWKIGCIIVARPTKSKMLHVQIMGRVIRANSGYPDGLVLDHSDNCLRLGLPPEMSNPPLCTAKKGEKKKAGHEDPLPKECGACGFLKPPKIRECPVCKFTPERTSDIEEDDGELVQISGAKSLPKPKPDEKRQFFAEMLGYAASKGKSHSYALAVFKDRYKEWPARKHDVIPMDPSPATLSYVRAKNIRYAKSLEKQKGA